MCMYIYLYVIAPKYTTDPAGLRDEGMGELQEGEREKERDKKAEKYHAGHSGLRKCVPESTWLCQWHTGMV